MEWITDPAIWVGLRHWSCSRSSSGWTISSSSPSSPTNCRLSSGTVRAPDRPVPCADHAARAAREHLLGDVAHRAAVQLRALQISWRDLILIAGGVFLLVKATTEIHDRDRGAALPAARRSGTRAFWPVVTQIVVLDAVFSLDSVITAVGMVDELYVMMAAVIIAVAAMLVAAATHAIHRRPPIAHHPVPGLPSDGGAGAGGRWTRRACPQRIRLCGDRLLGVDRSAESAGVAQGAAIRPRKKLTRQQVADAVLRLLGGAPVPASRDDG